MFKFLMMSSFIYIDIRCIWNVIKTTKYFKLIKPTGLVLNTLNTLNFESYKRISNKPVAMLLNIEEQYFKLHVIKKSVIITEQN